MNDITLSCMLDPDALRLDGFEPRPGVHVRTQHMDWANAWDELLRIALYSQGPDVSEIGSTWLGSLIEMDVLRPLTAWNLSFPRSLEGFFPAARWAIMKPGDYQIWAMPLLTDTRVLYYRRDLLAQAGIDEATAFKTANALVRTLEQLQAKGVQTPWAMPTIDQDVIYNAAPWVWAAGGRFRTRDGRHFRLQEPEAQAGLNAYLGLHRFLAPPAQGLDILGTDALFQEGKVTATISGPWLLRFLEQDNVFLSEVGVAQVPGIPFVGGSHLVVWRHARNEPAITGLMRYLANPDIQRLFFQQTGNLPSRVEVLNDEPFVSEPRYQVFAQSLKVGRVLKVSYRWAAVEQRLVNMLRQMWADLAADPQLDLKDELLKRTKALIEELEHTILGAW